MTIVAATLVIGIAGCRNEPIDAVAARRLAKTLLTDRFTAGRLAHDESSQRCDVVDTAMVPRERCGGLLAPDSKRFATIQTAAQDLRRAMGPSPTPDALHAQALLQLRRLDGMSSGIDRAVASLERARRRSPENPEILNDLAVAYLELGQRDQALEPMVRALDAVERALEQDSTLVAALFNRALIQQRLYLTAGAAHAWSRFLAAERDDRWRTEAAAHARRLAGTGSARSWADIAIMPNVAGDSVRAEVMALVRRSRNDAREHAFALLREWGIAVGRHDGARASATLGMVREIARALDALQADRSVSLAVRSIDAHARDSASVRAFASAHVDLWDGLTLHEKANFQNATAPLARAERVLRGLGSPAARWATFFYAFTQIELADYAGADARLQRLVTETSPDEPALLGKAIAAQGVSHLRRGNYENAIRKYREARPCFQRAGEAESDGYVSYVLTEALNLAGQSWAGYEEAYRGLRLLSPFRASNHLNNHLTTVATLARRAGFGYAGLAIMQELRDVAPRVGKAQVLAWAHRAHARELMLNGRSADARAAIAEASRWADSVPPGFGGRDRVLSDVQLVKAQLLRDDDPKRAREMLADVIKAYEPRKSSGRLPTALYTALYEMSRIAAATGDSAAARANLDRAVAAIEQQSRTFSSAEVRASFSETVENVFDAMIELQLSSGHPDSAFTYLERERVAAWSVGAQSQGTKASATSPTLDDIRARLRPEMVVVEFALLHDQLVAWTVSHDGSRHYTKHISRDSIANLVDQYLDESRGANTEPASASALLFDLLIGPILGNKRGVRQMSVIPDRELSRLPFSGLWDRRDSHYVVQDIEVRTLPSAVFLVEALSRSVTSMSAARALVVGNPSLDTSRGMRLPPLPGAAHEAERVAALYRGSRLLTDGRARRDSVVNLLATSSVFHFAGHAIANAEQPELSYLALGSTGGGNGDDGTLRGSEIGKLRLSNLKLAVLSACSTLNPRSSHTGAIAGLTYSFLRAGVPATISTLWDVNDDVATEMLVEFHRRFAAGTSAAEALHLAQLQAMRSGRPEMRTPRAWAAFIYTGP